MDAVTPVEFPFMCEYCPRGFDTKRGLGVHKAYAHKTDAGLNAPGTSNANVNIPETIVHTAPETAAEQSGVQHFICPVCQRSYSTKSGLGVHFKKAHPTAANAAAAPPLKKVRWKEEEVYLLAEREVALRRTGVTNISQALSGFLPGRSYDSIKSRRREVAYQTIVKQLLETVVEPPVPTQQSEADSLVLSPGPSSEALNLSGTSSYPDEPDQDPGQTPAISASTAETSDAKLEAELRRVLEEPPMPGYHSEELLEIVTDTLDGVDIGRRLDGYLDKIFPPPPVVIPDAREPSHRRKNLTPTSRREAKKKNFAKIQELFRLHRSRCAQTILEDNPEVNPFSTKDFTDFWGPAFNAPGIPECEFTEEPVGEEIKNIWDPISVRELNQSLISTGTSAGPDRVDSRSLRAIPKQLLCTILNLLMKLETLPQRLNDSRTIFLAKTQAPSSAADFRPISVTSVITRQFHRILARRLQRCIKWNPAQRAFISSDGIMQNIMLLMALLRDSKTKLKSLFLACIDLRKAFDRVYHAAVLKALRRLGCPRHLIRYLRYVYATGRTYFQGPSGPSSHIRITRGVRQGDPLSPSAFNAVIDELIGSLPNSIGYTLDRVKLNCIAFADDLILIASSRAGLQRLLDETARFLATVGLDINPDKSKTLALIPDGKTKKAHVSELCTFKVNNAQLPAMRVIDTLEYLGVQISPFGDLFHQGDHLKDLLTKVTKAPLKPQQRLFILKHFVLPKFNHKLTFGKLTAGNLKKLDTQVRTIVRKWLCLPKDTPLGYFHANCKDGGLGIPSFRWSIPSTIMKRLDKMRSWGVEVFEAVSRHPAVTRIENTARKLGTENGILMGDNASIRARWAGLLHRAVDGVGLKEANQVPAAQHWVDDGTRLLSGRDYIQAIKLRINALPSRARTTRGRDLEARCRAGCSTKETTQHVLQGCPRTHEARIKRHDAVVNLLGNCLRQKGHLVHIEPHYHTIEGLRKPDVVAVDGERTFVVDIQIVQAGPPLAVLHQRKASYYSSNKNLCSLLLNEFKNQDIRFSTLTINWRGVIAKESGRTLQQLGITSKQTKLLAVRAMQGSLTTWGTFNRSTGYHHGRGHLM